MLVIKRDGKKVKFDKNKILIAIEKSANEIGKIIDINKIADLCEQKIITQNKKSYKIEDIQYIVECILMEQDHDIARSYIEYRNQRDLIRENKTNLAKNITGLMNQSNLELLNENANKDGKVIPTQRDLLAGILSKHYGLNHLLPKDVSDAHKSGDIHFHDLDYSPFFPMFNCMLIDLEYMLNNGFRLGNAQITSPKSIGTACAVTAQIIAQVASHIYGGNTINGIDQILAPYVKLSYNKNLKIAEIWKIEDKENFAKDMTEKQTYDAFQGLEYEINTLHCANGQTPFTTLGFGLGTSWEEKIIQKSILKVRINGLGENGSTAIFPKLVFAIKKGVNFEKEDPNYDIKQIALECSSKRMYPDILNYEQTVKVTGSFKYPMGCRSFLNCYTENGKEIHAGRNNLGVVSINLPRIAIESKKNIEDFFKILDKKLEICYKALWCRINSLNNVPASVAPILYIEGAMGVKLNPDDMISELFKNGKASISLGYIGLNEVANAMFGDEIHSFESIEKQNFLESVMLRLKQIVLKWTNESGYGFSLYSTPSESLCDRFCKLDKNKFGEIKGVTDKGYYTNSFHLDVEKKVNPYQKIIFESRYLPYASGGNICYGEYPNMKNNIEALEDVWNFSYNVIPYYGTNTPVDVCYCCNFKGEVNSTSNGYQCPKCKNLDPKKMNVIRRVCGYLGEPSTREFITGKQNEVSRRVKHL